MRDRSRLSHEAQRLDCRQLDMVAKRGMARGSKRKKGAYEFPPFLRKYLSCEHAKTSASHFV